MPFVRLTCPFCRRENEVEEPLGAPVVYCNFCRKPLAARSLPLSSEFVGSNDRRSPKATEKKLRFKPLFRPERCHREGLETQSFSDEDRKKLSESALFRSMFHLEERALEAPSFRLPSLDGRIIDSAAYADEMLLVHFFATFCEASFSEVPSLARFYEKFERSFGVIAVVVDGDKGLIADFVDDMGITFPVLLDEGGRVAHQFNTQLVPETHVIVRGRIVAFVRGARAWDSPWVEPLIKEWQRS